MNISYNWLKEYIEFSESPEEIAAILTDLGLEIGGVEERESVKGGLKGLVVGHVLTCEKHPDADKLKLTTVDVGGESPLNIVCGAPNVNSGQKVVVATIGTELFHEEGSFKIKKSKIRGALSEGMLCAEDEIGLGGSHDGIINLDNSIAAGTLVKDVYKVNTDYILEVDITPNRADALSHVGVARDLKAYFDVHQNGRDLKLASGDTIEAGDCPVSVAIKDENACPKYLGLSIEGVKIEASPDWLTTKLEAIGVKAINNVVDITNFVMMELGQPLHAFDQSKIKTGIEIKTGLAGQELELLDNNKIKLDQEDLVICDGDKALCLAGVMGGAESGVTENSTSIFLEAAYFNPVAVRKAAKRHATKTDSSYRFERGVDPNGTKQAIERAAQLITELAGGSIVGGINEQGQQVFDDFNVPFRFKQCAKVLGQDLGEGKIKEIFDALSITYAANSTDELQLKVPPYRVDVQRECDVIEDILRVYGYNNIQNPATLNSSIVFEERLPAEKLQVIVSDLLTSNGFNEILCNSLTKTKHYEGLDQFTAEQHVELLNPLSQDLNILRRSLVFGGLESIERNQNRKQSDLRLYEFGKVYWKDEEGKYQEEQQIALFLSGLKQSQQWNSPQMESSFYTLKGVVELLVNRLGIKKLKSKASNNPLFSDGIAVFFKKKLVLEYGQLNGTFAQQAGVKQAVYFAQINWNNLLELASFQKVKYQALSKFQDVKRDLSLLLDREISFKQLEQLAFESERKLLKSVELFDVYEGNKLPENKKSYALSFQLGSDESTLKDKQIDKVMQKLISTFETKLGAQLR